MAGVDAAFWPFRPSRSQCWLEQRLLGAAEVLTAPQGRCRCLGEAAAAAEGISEGAEGSAGAESAPLLGGVRGCAFSLGIGAGFRALPRSWAS